MTIASALDKLNDKLAGSDQPASQTIEGMILRLIDNIDQGGGGGGGGGALIIGTTYTDTSTIMDKTFAEIFSAMQTCYIGVIMEAGEGDYILTPVIGIHNDPEGETPKYSVSIMDEGVMTDFVADTPDDYPVYSFGD